MTPARPGSLRLAAARWPRRGPGRRVTSHSVLVRVATVISSRTLSKNLVKQLLIASDGPGCCNALATKRVCPSLLIATTSHDCVDSD